MSATAEMCDCGQPLHYAKPEQEPWVKLLIEQLGPTVIVSTSKGSWHVPRHWISLHGLSNWQLPRLAAKYGWRSAGFDVEPTLPPSTQR